jgi:hypothetical protein
MPRKTKKVRFNVPGSKTLETVGKKGVKGVSNVFGFLKNMMTKKRGHSRRKSSRRRR